MHKKSFEECLAQSECSTALAVITLITIVFFKKNFIIIIFITNPEVVCRREAPGKSLIECDILVGQER